MGIWNQVWKAVGAVMVQHSIGGQLAIVLGAALLALATLEGLHLMLFPRRVLRRLVGRYPDVVLDRAAPEPEVVQPRSLPAPKPQMAHISGAPRRWQRPERQRQTRFASRMRRPMI